MEGIDIIGGLEPIADLLLGPMVEDMTPIFIIFVLLGMVLSVISLAILGYLGLSGRKITGKQEHERRGTYRGRGTYYGRGKLP